MSIDPDRPIDLQNPEWQTVFRLLQGNIFKSHRRDHVALIPFKLKSGGNVRGRLRTLALKRVTSAYDQLDPIGHTEAEDKSTDAKAPLGGLYVSVWGYLKLGYSPQQIEQAFVHPRDSENTNWFLEGMEHAGRYILDPPKITQQPEYRDNNIDAMLLLACGELNPLQSAVDDVLKEMDGWAEPITVEHGRVLRKDGQTVEPFGFRDGLSRPNYFKADDPEFQAPRAILVRDLLAGRPHAYGSYLVYRKLEQNVKAFKDAEARIQKELDLPDADRDRAAAMIIGRFRDGTPLALKGVPAGGDPTNDFDHNDDKLGLKCPLHAHIRKVRPRTEGTYRDRMIRRGVPYGPYDPYDITALYPPPEVGTGLLFMSFQADLQNQFGQVFAEWVNKVHFEGDYTGQDPLLGHGSIPVPQAQQWRKVWNDDKAPSVRLQCGHSPRFVTLKGGEFMFAPSLAWFESL